MIECLQAARASRVGLQHVLQDENVLTQLLLCRAAGAGGSLVPRPPGPYANDRPGAYDLRACLACRLLGAELKGVVGDCYRLPRLE